MPMAPGGMGMGSMAPNPWMIILQHVGKGLKGLGSMMQPGAPHDPMGLMQMAQQQQRPQGPYGPMGSSHLMPTPPNVAMADRLMPTPPAVMAADQHGWQQMQQGGQPADASLMPGAQQGFRRGFMGGMGK